MLRKRIGITLGDPRGIGPEVTDKALRHPELRDAADFVLIGPEGMVRGNSGRSVGRWAPGGTPAEAGRLAGEAIRCGVEMALCGEVDALVTAPIEKSAFRAGGWDYPGHTEMLGELTGSRAVGMMMSADRTALGGSLRVVLATTHIALRDVASAVTSDLLVEQALLTRDALSSWWGVERPRLALGALNPHASDGGLFGDEECRVFGPALARLRGLAVDVVGPLPADTVFGRAIRGEFDAVIAPYHDVGMAAFKTVAFGGGVNVTLGLPFPRTSPDHGTAMDIAGRGIADPTSMVEAITLAIRLAPHFDSPSPRK
ncbi:4-hydroxythreonine-4-phosphate dehydrogenase PdxA [soil metagenome]